MNKLISKKLLSYLGSAFVMIAFQNCSDVGFSSAKSNPTQSQQTNGTPTTTNGTGTTATGGGTTTTNGGTTTTTGGTETTTNTGDGYTNTTTTTVTTSGDGGGTTTTTGGGTTTSGNGSGGNDCGCGDNNYQPPETIHSGQLTAAFEDLYPDTPIDQNDNDYNDFVVGYTIDEHNQHGHIDRIELNFNPKNHGAAYDHSFLINLTGSPEAKESGHVYKTKSAFKGTALAVLTNYDENGNVLKVTDVDPEHDITIFASTTALFTNGKANQHAKLVVYMNDSDSNETRAREKINLSRYRVILKVKNTGHVLEAANNDPTDISKDGHPFGFIVDGDFKPPAERQNIEKVYPKFALYRTYLLERLADPSTQGSHDAIFWYQN